MRGRKPKPTHLRLITGNPGKRPINVSEPKPAVALPEPPAELTQDAQHEWDRLASQLTKLGILTVIDRGALAACCQAYGRWMAAERAIASLAKRQPVLQGLLVKTKNGNLIQNPLVGIANKAMSDYVRYAAEFGMTPSARSRIATLKTPDEEDPTEQYFAS